MDVSFTINEKIFKVNSETVPIDTSLNTFIRNNAHLPGTKFMCLEGGCGACIVTVRGVNSFTKGKTIKAVNSCLLPVFSCHGLDIVTIEGIGGREKGYHPIQKRLSDFNGSQCGYCSPGMVMNMHSLLESHDGKVSMADIENSFGGNICRCTGYRPILDAFKSMATDADEKLLRVCKDIEDLSMICPKTNRECRSVCPVASDASKNQPEDGDGKGYDSPIAMCFQDNRKWYKVTSVPDILTVLKVNEGQRYMLVAGNTAHGVYRRPQDIGIFIDVTGVSELHSYSIGSVLEIGANVTLTDAMGILEKAASQFSNFEYCSQLVQHLDLVANVPVRNNGTLAGNMSIKHQHNEFPSDVFLILETVGAKLSIACRERTSILSLLEYLKTDMVGKVITKITLPALKKGSFNFKTYKIRPRTQNAHAYVNAGFLLQMRDKKVSEARICFGGINPQFVHAVKTEKFLVGKDLCENQTLQQALQLLSTEIQPDSVMPDASPEYRKDLALSLFYKFVLATSTPTLVAEIYKSGGEVFQRPLSSGTQVFETNEKVYPLTQNIPKIEGMIQTAGEAQYVNDIPSPPGMLWGAFVLATQAQSQIVNIDAKQALQMDGVEAFYSAKDISGNNNFMNMKVPWSVEPEEFLCSGLVLYNGQPAGIILADTFEKANLAASRVKIEYARNDRKLLPTLHDVLEHERGIDSHSMSKMTKPEIGLSADVVTTSGHFELGLQYHFTMETQSCLCIPSDEGLDVYSATQWLDHVQAAVSESLNMPQNKINMYVKRLGGGYGCKISRSSMIACACALAAHHTNRPVRLILTLEANMQAIGKRNACISNYTAETDVNGKILKLQNRYDEDYGCSLNEPVIDLLTNLSFPNCYQSGHWDSIGKAVKTDSASQTFCRAPGTTEDITMIENIMEHISRTTGKDPISVRLENIAETSPIKKHLQNFVESIEYEKRKLGIESFNTANRWKKRGLAVMPLQYIIGFFGIFNVTVSIYHHDGTVSVTHGAVEMGQGLNTKAVQVAAHVLGLPVDKISVKHSRSATAPNNAVTGASMSSEAVAYAIKMACDILNERIKPVREANIDDKWEDVIQKCYLQNIDLCGNYTYKADELLPYFVYGVSAAEIEIDVLTGEMQILRVDILEDTGESMSPGIDVGQIEGAFTMGIGYFLTEKLVYDRKTGKLMTDRTWTYKPPGVKDIPIDFRITLLQKTPNKAFVLRSKATGEPAFSMAFVLLLALRNALDAARSDAKTSDEWYSLGAPTTVEDIFLKAGNNIQDYKLN